MELLSVETALFSPLLVVYYVDETPSLSSSPSPHLPPDPTNDDIAAPTTTEERRTLPPATSSTSTLPDTATPLLPACSPSTKFCRNRHLLHRPSLLPWTSLRLSSLVLPSRPIHPFHTLLLTS